MQKPLRHPQLLKDTVKALAGTARIKNKKNCFVPLRCLAVPHHEGTFQTQGGTLRYSTGNVRKLRDFHRRMMETDCLEIFHAYGT